MKKMAQYQTRAQGGQKERRAKGGALVHFFED